MLDENYMRRAITLAKHGEGRVNPNPLVGAVIVKDGRIIGEGYHASYGELHAERHAIRNLTESAEGADMYVTLEPCCHYGKQPPCTEAIIDAGIKHVYIGSTDPNPLVAGKGIKMLEMAKIEVETGVLKEECDSINPVFFHFIQTKTPYVVMKYAMTMDGKIAAYTGKSKWITSEASRYHVQHTRNKLKGIMVGIGTVLQDNPLLTCRLEGGRNPVRIICDSHLRMPLDSQIMQTAAQAETILATVIADAERHAPYLEQGASVLVIPERNGRVDLRALMEELGSRMIDSILLEGGGTLNYSALEAGIVNRVQVYVAPKILGGAGNYTPVMGQGAESPETAFCFGEPRVTPIGSDILLEYELRREA